MQRDHARSTGVFFLLTAILSALMACSWSCSKGDYSDAVCRTKKRLLSEAET